MTIFIIIADSFAPLVDSTLIKRSASTTLTSQEILLKTDLTISITDDSHVRQLNLQYRNIDAPTDVLAFPAEYIDPDTGHKYLGDIIISFERASKQAKSSHHPVNNELQLLVVHGVLHLLGFDHDQIDKKNEMWSAQNQILKLMGANVSPPD